LLDRGPEPVISGYKNDFIYAPHSGIGFVFYGLSIMCFILALRHLGASRTGAYFSAAPFVGAFVSILVWHDPVSMQFLMACSFMAFGIYLHISENHEHVHTHEEMCHEHSHVHDEHHQHEHDFPVSKGEKHSHPHRHTIMTHSHAHFPDMHHTHRH
jgi:multidrug transporter EmrE-like cation transporter